MKIVAIALVLALASCGGEAPKEPAPQSITLSVIELPVLAPATPVTHIDKDEANHSRK
jgi:hypothetical protein